MEILQVYNGYNVSAKSAGEVLDIESILNGCALLEQAIGNLNYSVRDLSISSNCLNKDAFSLDNNSPYSDTINEYVDDIQKFQTSSFEIINQIRVNAVNRYNQIQDSFNQEAANNDYQ